jgi:hypothetical protein
MSFDIYKKHRKRRFTEKRGKTLWFSVPTVVKKHLWIFNWHDRYVYNAIGLNDSI